MTGEALYVLFVLWALAMLVVFVQATRLSYRIEARSRLDSDVVARFRAGGPGWQSRINEILRKAAGL
ncbi:BrnA antitoxin family protein [Mesorhizobium sp. B2-8-5]|uniref:BrnA antitoxin family protein n=1 Tax=Mesorhizobium sp. B2-8-5 TaxID=2589903 RepID=UPI0039AEEED2